ncbi:RluA family pseudouridine synthase [Candidatus Nomurabacteria bacterium]|nr:RluA family pseudouridine synthase [Candidatus Nomurabacteria bacterium]
MIFLSNMIEPEILFEDANVIVVNKPVGLMVHEDGVSKEETVVDWLLSRAPEARGVGEAGYSPKGEVLERSGVVHRLDRDTSGVLILAKNQEAFVHLKAQFKDRQVKKEYVALVYGTLPEERGVIDRPIGRSASDFRKRSAERGAKGTLREAITHYERLEEGQYEGETFSLVRLLPKTGRTHQLRVHLKAIGRPIVGDSLYAGKKRETSNNIGLERLALHAEALTLTLPSGEAKRFVAPLPSELAVATARIAPIS